MTNELTQDEILLAWASAARYPRIYVDHSTSIGPGDECWHQQLSTLTGIQRLLLQAKVTRQMTRLQCEALGERYNDGSAATHRIAKEGLSNPEPGRPAARRIV
ncbi:MAG TPA: hypothetical protein VHV10_14740, partial [Ktedonobacteraceae bacterium]|nr:hypothetical protein [Ktedonobacteraceae bacterium]